VIQVIIILKSHFALKVLSWKEIISQTIILAVGIEKFLSVPSKYHDIVATVGFTLIAPEVISFHSNLVVLATNEVLFLKAIQPKAPSFKSIFSVIGNTCLATSK